MLPTLWFRNLWSWWPDEPKPSLQAVSGRAGSAAIKASDATIGSYTLYCEGQPGLLFTENETNNRRLFGTANPTQHVKDSINDYVVAGRQDAVNRDGTGTKAAAHYELRIGARETARIRLRLVKDLDRYARAIWRAFRGNLHGTAAGS